MAVMRRRVLIGLGVLLVAAGAAFAWLSVDRCGEWPEGEPLLLSMGIADGQLQAGAAVVEISPPYPVVRGGYRPLRSEVDSAEAPLFARAVWLQVEDVSVAVVSLDLLLVSPSLHARIRDATAALSYGQLWVAATHAHSSVGGFDPRLISEVAGTGRYRPDVEDAIVKAAVAAVEEAQQGRRPARLSHGMEAHPDLVMSRSEGSPDARLSRLALTTVEGGPLAEVVIFGAHPTLQPREGTALHPDYPGLLAASRGDAGVSLFLLGAGGNAAAVDRSSAEVAAKLSARLETLPLVPVERTTLGLATVSSRLPRPDASRLVPTFARAAVENALCEASEREVELQLLALGPLRLLSAPAELTEYAGSSMQTAAKATRSVSLVNGYVGYVENGSRVSASLGEASRQYFGPSLLERLEAGAALLGQVLPPQGPPPPSNDP